MRERGRKTETDRERQRDSTQEIHARDLHKPRQGMEGQIPLRAGAEKRYWIVTTHGIKLAEGALRMIPHR